MAARRRIGEDDRLQERIRSVLLSLRGGHRPTAGEISRVLRMSSRTLQRKLRQQHTSFRSMLAATLRLRAVSALADPSSSIAEVASRLGFSDPANFSRAFRRWTGTSPQEFRRSSRPEIDNQGRRRKFMRSVRTWLLVLVVVMLGGAAHAQTVNWTYVEGGWATLDPDHGDRENGWLLGGSFALGKVPIHLFGEWDDFGDIDVWQAGGGWHGLLGKKADLFADGAFYDADVEDGFKIRFGVRWMLTKRLELNGNLAWTDLDLTDNKSFTANAIYNLGERFAIGGGGEWGDNWKVGRVFIRFNFGKKS